MMGSRLAASRPGGELAARVRSLPVAAHGHNVKFVASGGCALSAAVVWAEVPR